VAILGVTDLASQVKAELAEDGVEVFSRGKVGSWGRALGRIVM
jgi:hypothetical protein